MNRKAGQFHEVKCKLKPMVRAWQGELLSSPVRAQSGRSHQRRQAWVSWPCGAHVNPQGQKRSRSKPLSHISKVRISKIREQMAQEYPRHSTEKGQGWWLQSLLMHSRYQQKPNLIFNGANSHSGFLVKTWKNKRYEEENSKYLIWQSMSN